MTPNTLRRSRFAATLVGLVVSAVPTVGQTRLYLLMGGGERGGRLIQVNGESGSVVADSPVRHANTDVSGPQVTPDGRFVLWSGSEAGAWDYGEDAWKLLVSLFDLAAQRQSTPFAADDGATYLPLTVHPSAMRAFLGLSPSGLVTVAEPGHTYVLPSPPCGQPRFSKRSGDGRRLSYYCNQPRSVMVADSVDGHLLGTVALGASAFSIGVTSHVLDGAGSTMYAVDWDNAYEGDAVLYRRFDVATGALLAERRGSTSVIFSWTLNETTGHLYAGTWSGILVLDATTLSEIGWIPGWYPATFPQVVLDPDLPHAYIAWPKDSGGVLRLSAIHTGTFATLGSLDIQFDGQFVGLALGPRPPRLSGLQVVMAGNLAALTWTIAASRSIATGLVVEAGFTPGATAVRLPVAAGATSLSVAGVPPGRYYVRVRSVNGTGLGTPSNEVVVEVP